MRFVAYVAAILTLAACGSSSAAARPSPSAAPTPSPQASASAAVSPSASPSPRPSASVAPSPTPVTGGYAVLVTTGTADTYTVSIIGTDASVVASATPNSPTQVGCGTSAAALVSLPVSTSDTRVYFLDAGGNVRFLTPNGETGVATRVPTGGNVRSMFAVSPDDSRIAVVQDTFTATGALTVLYVEDLNGGGHHAQIFSESGAYTLWPTGWINTSFLVVAKVPACTQGGGPGCCGPQEYHVIDPATGARLYTVGGSTCVPVGSPSPAGTMCENTAFTKANAVNWTGTTTQTLTIQGPTPAYLSPEGTQVALVVNNQTTFAGAKQTLNVVACGWIDSTHVIAGGDAESQPRVASVPDGAIAPIAAQGVCGGRIPGGL